MAMNNTLLYGQLTTIQCSITQIHTNKNKSRN